MTWRSLAIASCVVSVLLVAPARGQDPGPQVVGALLRPEWSVERTRAGRPHVVGYVHNSSLSDAANVWLRVERLTSEGKVHGVYRWRVVGDVLSSGRLAFDVPVPEADATYRVLVESVDWVKECR